MSPPATCEWGTFIHQPGGTKTDERKSRTWRQILEILLSKRPIEMVTVSYFSNPFQCASVPVGRWEVFSNQLTLDQHP
jgi:hypothetical protein